MQNPNKALIFYFYFVVVILFSVSLYAEEQIRIVGSSTVFPFSTAVAEEFGRSTKYKSPIVEQTGTGNGMKLFCDGKGPAFPDIINASRRIKKNEYNKCIENGIDMVEVKIGYDGIVFANSKKGQAFNLTTRDIYLALAAKVPINSEDTQLQDNPYQTWKDVNSSLPDIKIEVLGPPPTSGTRDAFVELAMEKGAESFPFLKTLKESSKAKKNEFKIISHTIREDGAFIEAGENDNLIVQKLAANPEALGIFGFSFLDQNSDKLRGANVNGIAPKLEKIMAGDYAISRSLYFYIKKNHTRMKPSITKFSQEFTSEDAMGQYGYLMEKGLIPLPEDEYKTVSENTKNLVELEL